MSGSQQKREYQGFKWLLRFVDRVQHCALNSTRDSNPNIYTLAVSVFLVRQDSAYTCTYTYHCCTMM